MLLHAFKFKLKLAWKFNQRIARCQILQSKTNYAIVGLLRSNCPWVLTCTKRNKKLKKKKKNKIKRMKKIKRAR